MQVSRPAAGHSWRGHSRCGHGGDSGGGEVAKRFVEAGQIALAGMVGEEERHVIPFLEDATG